MHSSHVNGVSLTSNDSGPDSESETPKRRTIPHNVKNLRSRARDLEKCARKREKELKALTKCAERIEAAQIRISTATDSLNQMQSTLDDKFGPRYTNRP
jgi:septal ring factor EnvC (AmiA/AmiB activator)